MIETPASAADFAKLVGAENAFGRNDIRTSATWV
jgi:hypothetical protein